MLRQAGVDNTEFACFFPAQWLMDGKNRSCDATLGAHVGRFGITTLECLANALEVNVILRAFQTLTHGNHVVLIVLVARLVSLSAESADGSLFKLRDDAR